MANLVPQTTNESAVVASATAPKYFKGASDQTFRRRLWLAMLQRYGVVESNANSFSCTWAVEYSQPEVRQYGDSGDLEFNEHDALQQLTVDVRGYTATDRLTLKQREMNSGATQIDDLYKNKSIRLAKRVRQVLCDELYIDGNASGNTNRFMGAKTFLEDDGNTVTADKVAKPSDSYAGQNTAPATNGGTWSSDLGTSPNATLATDWPLGQGDVEYDWLSPLLVNITSTSWPSGSAKWIDNCEDAMRFARITQTSRGAKGDDQRTPFMHMLAPDLYADFLTFYSSRNRQIVPHSEADNLGFTDTMNFEGDMVHYEYSTPAGEGYGISPTMMELFHLGPQLMNPVGPEWAITKAGYLYLVWVFGNLRFSPKFFTKYEGYA